MALTDTAIRGAKPDTKPFKMYDREGLFLLVNPVGSKLWRWRYRFGGKEKLMALGEYPLVGLRQAREIHLAARKSLVAGTDPMSERKAKGEAQQKEAEARQREAENSFENVAREWWKWWLIGKSPRHADTTMRRMEADVFPAYGPKSINQVTAPARELSGLVLRNGMSEVIRSTSAKSPCPSLIGKRFWKQALACS